MRITRTIGFMALGLALSATLAPAGPRDDYRAGLRAARKWDYQRAIVRLDRAIKSGQLPPRLLARAHLYRCRLHADHSGRLRLALADCRRAVSLRPDWALAYYHRGNVYLDLGQHRRAVADYTRAIRLDPEDADAYNNRGWAYQELGRYRMAIADYGRAVALAPGDYLPYDNLAWLLATCPDGRLVNGRRAVALAQKAVRLKRNPSTLDTLSVAYARAAQWALARRTNRQAIALLKSKPGYSRKRLAAYQSRLEDYRFGNLWQVKPPRQAATPAVPTVHEGVTAGGRTGVPPAAPKFNYHSFYDAVKFGELDKVIYWIKVNAGAVKLIMTYGLGRGTALHLAAWTGRTKIAAFLIKMGAKVDARIDGGDTPLHVAAEFSSKPIVILLLNKGARVTASGYMGQSVLHSAVRGGNLPIIDFLIRKGAKVNHRDERGMTPLHVAAEGGRKSLVLFLIQNGADIKARDKQGETALYDSIRNGNTGVAALLIAKGAPVDSRNKMRGDTPLHVAARTGSTKMVSLLINRGAKVNSKNNHGDTPLHVAAWRGHLAVVSLLIAKGAKINARNKDGETPLLDAARAGQKAVVKLLVRRGANVNAKDKRGRRALKTYSVPIRSSRKRWRRARRRQRAAARRIGRPVVFTNLIGMKFVLIPPGSFLMGTTLPSYRGCGPKYDDAPQHRVIITRAFYMQTTEVTQAQWLSVMGANPSHFKNCDNCPVENVSWDDVQEFIRRLNKREGIKYRLPTEAEWEYACRAGTTTPFYFGREATAKLANVDSDDNKTVPVGGYRPNAWRLYNMHGNVMEYCSDWYGKNYYGRSPKRDPRGPKTGYKKVIRGCNWGIPADMCMDSAMRSMWSPNRRSDACGFRLVRMP